MAVDIRLPNINAKTEAEQQIRSYLIQLAEQLNFALKNADTTNNTVTVNTTPKSLQPSSQPSTVSPEATFNSIKALIIKSAEIVDAYYEEMSRKLEGQYVAQSDFGTFQEQTAQYITETSTSIDRVFTNIQEITTSTESLTLEIGGLNTSMSESFTSLSTQIGDVDSKVDESFTSLSTEIGGIDSKVDESFTSLSTEIGNVDSKVNESVTTLSTEIGNVDSKIDESTAALSSEIGGVDSKVNKANSDIQDTNKRIEDSNTDLASKIGDLASETNSKIDDVNTNLSDEINDVKNGLQALNTSIVEVTANIRTGELYRVNEIPVYGLEVGQIIEVDGEEVFNKFARFVADRLSFYDQNGAEVAYISDYRLYIYNVEITGIYKLGGLVDTVMASGDVVEKWVGRG